MKVDLMHSVKTLRLILLVLAAVCLVSGRGVAFPGGVQAENTAQRNDRVQTVESKLPSLDRPRFPFPTPRCWTRTVASCGSIPIW